MTLIDVTLPDGSTAQVESNEVVVMHRVDAQGVYLGLVGADEGVLTVPYPPPIGEHWYWAAPGQWQYAEPLAETKAAALQRIDAAAGAQRLVYITDVPGQQAVYLRKMAEAADYLAAVALDAQAEVPPYIAAESEATGGTAAQAAQGIADTAAQWDAVLSPAIEGARIAGKRAVAAAEDAAAVQQAMDDALAALAAL